MAGGAAVLGILLPSRISGYWELSETFALSAFATPLDLDFIFQAQRANPQRMRASYELGIRASFLVLDSFTLQPTLSHQGFYRRGQERYWNIGLSALFWLNN